MSEILRTEKEWGEDWGRFSFKEKSKKIFGNFGGIAEEEFEGLWLRVFKEGTNECVAEVPCQGSSFESPELPEGFYDFTFARLVGEGKERQPVLPALSLAEGNGVEGNA